MGENIETLDIAVVGAGPAGLFAAERLAASGHAVTVFDRMPSPARKFLLAGRGGLNLTHAEPLATFLTRYGEATPWLTPALQAFPPAALRAWAEQLGQPTFTGTSGRVFPNAFKAAPLLRAWLRHLAAQRVTFRPRHALLDLQGASPSAAPRLRFATPQGEVTVTANAVLLALGGASWPRMGSDAGWVPVLRQHGVAIAPLAPANCGLRIAWSAHLIGRFAGAPLKRLRVTLAGQATQGDAIITRTGLEGGAIYPLAAALRRGRAGDPSPHAATLRIDLRPDLDEPALAARLGGETSLSLANRLRRAGLSPAAAALLREIRPHHPQTPLAALIISLPLPILGLEPIERAISTAGGIQNDALTENLMLKALPGIFAAGEMLDWEAPTGGYLLQACFATGAWAVGGMVRWLLNEPGKS